MENIEKFEKTEKELYQEFLNGNKKSFEELVIKNKDKLIYFLQNYLKNIDISEDIAQDVFVYILIHKTNYDFKYSFRTYLYTIGKSKAINYIKREKKIIYNDEVLNNMKIHDKEELEEKVFRTERARNLKDDINKLKKEYKLAIYLADIEGLSYKEIRRNFTKEWFKYKSINSQSEEGIRKNYKKGGG